MPRLAVASLSAAALTLALASCAGEPARSSSPPASAPAPRAFSDEAIAVSPPPQVTAATPEPAPEPTPPPVPAAAPPATPAPAAPPRDDDFVDVAALIPDAVLDMRYATEKNFTKKQLYPVARCLLRRAVAVRLAKVAEHLRADERRLVLWDCYRPASIQRALWELVPNPSYVAKPTFAKDGTPTGGSRHSRGAAVDASLADQSGALLPMPTDHDDFSKAAAAKRAHASPNGAEARRLAAAMVAEGFRPIASEWWHFDAPDASKYGFSDHPL